MSASRPRRLARAGASAALLLALMVLASVGLWIGVPLGWLWIAGRVQGATGSLGAAVGVMIAGVVVSIIALMPLLAWLSHKHSEASTPRNAPARRSIALEAILVVTAGVALVLFCVWFFVLSGANPIPFISGA